MDDAPPPPPLRWPGDAVAADVRREEARTDRARRELWLPLVTWLLGTPVCLYATFVLALTTGSAAFLSLLVSVVCLIGSPVAGLFVARRAGSGRAAAIYAAVLTVSVLVPLFLLARAFDAWG